MQPIKGFSDGQGHPIIQINAEVGGVRLEMDSGTLRTAMLIIAGVAF
jgi:hypothetical protein